MLVLGVFMAVNLGMIVLFGINFNILTKKTSSCIMLVVETSHTQNMSIFHHIRFVKSGGSNRTNVT